MLLSKSIKPKPALLLAIAWPARSTSQYRPEAPRRCAPGRKPRGRTSTPESPATGRTSPLSCCSGRYPNPLARPPRECEDDIPPKGARDREAHEHRSRGRCVVALYNTIRPHSSLGYRPPAPETASPPLPPSGSASLHLQAAMATEAAMH